ncbi:Ig-like domain-containing protein [Herbiconiux sp. SYSU D00978]|uniref:Ig-like domain-containing protein n=1 Tax=Herbiconiux sp. SYSU D00978 TaxID=2812562 RepID=UPI001A95C670|nr:Ig-like domain-containing protein [Herbiconiux sp. SYSU D00978]
MTLRTWIAARKSLAATVASSVLIGAVVAGIAVTSEGYTAQRMDLDDASVWVGNGERQYIGRANTEVLELNTALQSTSADVELVQRGATVLAVDRGNASLDVVDPATSTVAESVPLPPESPEVFLAGDRAVVVATGTGELWIQPLAELAVFDAESEPDLELGSAVEVSVDDEGTLFALSAEQGEVYRVDAARADTVAQTSTVELADPQDEHVITSVAGRWAVLDVDDAVLYADGTETDLSGAIGGDADAVPQRASAQGDAVLVAHTGGLVSVPVGGGEPTVLSDDRSGTPAAPARVDGCTYAGWSDGSWWTRCSGDPAGGAVGQLADMPAGATLAFAVNDDRVVLNDRLAGASWAVQRGGALIDNWDDLIVVDEDEEQLEENEQDTPPEFETAQVPPVAIDDEFGARPGRSTTLPVLLNDYDANGDALVISEVSPVSDEVGRIDLISNRQQIQLTLTPEASGTVPVVYTITDGRGGSATATATVTVRQPEENSPPYQARPSKSIVQSGNRVTTNVLGDFVDPDGDPFYLTSASAASPDAASFEPDGTVTFSDAGEGGELKDVALVVSDGTAQGAGTLSMTVRPAGEVDIIADPFVVPAYAGQDVTVRPLDHVRGGTGVLRLNGVPAKPGATIVPSYEAGTFTFTSTEVRDHILEYTVTDGDQTVTGIVRVVVEAPPNANAAPITIPKTVFVKTLTSDTIDVAGSDIDPAGGVLLVTELFNVPEASGVQAEVLDQRTVRVTLTGPLDAGPVVFNYTVTNGLASSTGTITVIEIPRPGTLQPPIATDDEVTVRVGDAIDIPVIANDEHPDGEQLTLRQELAQGLGGEGGLIFASGNVLRYLAPAETGDFTAIYTVQGPDGQTADGTVRISVREADAATNNAPVPTRVTSRVIAGETVRIPIPLTGIDPDGDSVQLLGQETNPELGSVVEVGSDYIEYQAGSYSAGTDTFTYSVVDGLGARATGTVRVGISPRPEGVRNPVANPDTATVRPGGSVFVQVLANDSDPDGSALTVTSVEPTSEGVEAEIVDDIVRITPPLEAGEYGLIYSIENAFGGTSSNFVTVVVDPDAPLAYPEADDAVLSLSDILDREVVEVDVLANVFFAEGEVNELGLAVLPGYGGTAEVNADKTISVTVRDQSQIIPFSVTHPEDPSIVSYAFIRVPGLDDALPQLDRGAEPLTVISEETLTIELNDYVVAVGDRPVRITGSTTVSATHSNGEDLVVDADTLRFTSADLYFGPASISFEVTDGESADDPDGRVATLVLPITVTPRDNQPPVFSGAVVDLEPGQEREFQLTRLTTYPYPDDLDELSYRVFDPQPTGLSYSLEGQTLTVRADEGVPKGTTTNIVLGVSDATNEGTAGRVQVTIVPSTRPLAQPAPDSAIAPRGTTTVVDVLANDGATNPFPGEPLRVVDIRGLEGASLPAGVTVRPNDSELTVSVADAAAPVNTTLQYQVADVTGDPDRYVWGAVTISVQDVPEVPTNLALTAVGDRSVTMRWNAPQANNSAITGYVVTLLGRDGSVRSTQNCPTTSCTIATPGNGPGNAVRVSVAAQNAIGLSETAVSAEVWSDVVPGAPRNVQAFPVDGGLALSWSRPEQNAGSNATHYVVTYNGRESGRVNCSAETCATTISGLSNGAPVTFTVSARNDVFNPTGTWNASPPQQATPAGAPVNTNGTGASASTDGTNTATVSWPNGFSNNGRAITNYFVGWYTGSNPYSCRVTGVGTSDPRVDFGGPGSQFASVGTATDHTFTGLQRNTDYQFVVFAYNGQGCTMSNVAAATPRAPSVAVTNVRTGDRPDSSGTNTWDARISNWDYAKQGGDDSSVSFEYELLGVNSSPQPLTDRNQFLLAGGAQYGVAELRVRVRAVETYPGGFTSVGPWSGEVALPTPVSLNGVSVTRETREDGRIVYNWLGLPQGAAPDGRDGYDTVEYKCEPPADPQRAGWQPMGQSGSCVGESVLDLPVPPSLQMRVTANGQTYGPVDLRP